MSYYFPSNNDFIFSIKTRRDGVRYCFKVKKEPILRDDEICELYKSGKTLQEVGDIYNISRERVRQIAKKQGVTGYNGGRTIKKFLRTDEIIKENKIKNENKEKKCFKKWGCTIDQYQILRSFHKDINKTPIYKYKEQRRNAKYRNIEWSLTLWEWWKIWEDSGKYNERGRGVNGYVMARWGDTGGYTKENIYITTQRHNARDYYKYNKEKWREIVKNKRESKG